MLSVQISIAAYDIIIFAAGDVFFLAVRVAAATAVVDATAIFVFATDVVAAVAAVTDVAAAVVVTVAGAAATVAIKLHNNI